MILLEYIKDGLTSVFIKSANYNHADVLEMDSLKRVLAENQHPVLEHRKITR